MPGAGTADCVALIGQVLKRQNPLIPQRVFHCLISEQAFSHCAENGGFEESKILLNEVTVSSVKPGWSLEAYPSFYSGKTWYF
jgi:hypothetical protein